MKIINTFLILSLASLLSSPIEIFATNDFFDQRYRGWIWFEQEEQLKHQQAIHKKHIEQESKKREMAKARSEVERFAKELDDLKYMMIRHPDNLEHIAAYKRKEAEMLDNAIKLDHSHRLVTLLNPDLVDHLHRPINLYGKKIKEEVDKEQNTKQIKSLSKIAELFLFFSSTCPYCQQLEPILHRFASEYGFKVEAVSIDGSESKYFKTHHNADLVTSLDLKFTPTVMLVTNDSEIRFELVRGAASFSEIEEQSLLALEHIRSRQNIGELSKGKP